MILMIFLTESWLNSLLAVAKNSSSPMDSISSASSFIMFDLILSPVLVLITVNSFAYRHGIATLPSLRQTENKNVHR